MSEGKKHKEGHDLWQEVTKTIRPLKSRPASKPLPPRRRVERLDEGAPLPAEWQTANAPTPQPFIDRKIRRKITKGIREVDRSVDLHGMTQDQAYRVLLSAVQGGVKRGDKILLVVTGKGGRRFSQTAPDMPVAYRTRDSFEQHTGVLKRMVPIWLEGADLKPFVESYGPAAQDHGGDGALYILLRKKFPGMRRGHTR